MLDFSQEQTQEQAGSGGSDFQPTPPGSIVKVRVELDSAGQYQVPGQHPSVSATQTGILQVNFKLTRLSNGDEMRFQKVALPIGAQPKAQTLEPGQKGLCHIGGAIMKAMLEIGGRGMAVEFESFNGIECPVILDGEWSKPNAEGKTFWNNMLYNPIENKKKGFGQIAVLTHDHPNFQTVMSGTDVLSDTPIPERPAQMQQNTYQQTYQQPQGGQPSWVGSGQQSQTNQVGFPTEASGLDDVPF